MGGDVGEMNKREVKRGNTVVHKAGLKIPV
jgi:hypothetical protein